jgi:tetratricopeptide (TPR) repeat protein
MNCQEAQTLLDELVDGPLADAGQAAALEAHLADCPACRADRDSLQAMVARTRALPRERTPGRDLWPEIARQLERRSPARRWVVAALPAAAALLLLAGTLGPRLWTPRSTGTASQTAATGASDRPGAVATTVPAVDPEAPLAEEQRYQEAVASLRAALQARRSSLSPATLEVVEHNLAVVDEALREIRRALRADPGNALLSQLLSSTNQQKVDVLQRMLELVERT